MWAFLAARLLVYLNFIPYSRLLIYIMTLSFANVNGFTVKIFAFDNIFNSSRGHNIMKEKTLMAQRIRELRKSENLTQAKLAQLIGLKETAIRSYENSLREPNSKAMAALEEYFNVSGAFLRGETDIKDYSPNDEHKQLTATQNQDELSDFLKKIQTAIKTVSNKELENTDGLLIELSHALNIQNPNERAAALLLLHMTARISSSFFFSYNRFTDELSKEDSADKALKLAVAKYSEALEEIKKQLLENI